MASLARPGANLTALSATAPGVVAKQLELLLDVVPGLMRVAALVDSTSPVYDVVWWDLITTAAASAGYTPNGSICGRRMIWTQRSRPLCLHTRRHCSTRKIPCSGRLFRGSQYKRFSIASATRSPPGSSRRWRKLAIGSPES